MRQTVLFCCPVRVLDPGLGIIHHDKPNRNSLALDLIEPIRPTVDSWALRLFADHTFRRSDFLEQPDGTVRLLPPLTQRLAATLPTWRSAVAPWAEHVAHGLAAHAAGRVARRTPLTRTGRRAGP